MQEPVLCIDCDVFPGIDVLYDIHVISDVRGRFLFRRQAVRDFICHDPLQAVFIPNGKKYGFRKQYSDRD